MSINTSTTPGAAAIDRLDSLPLEAQARVGSPEGNSPTLLRLLEMGLVPGSVVRLTRRAPLGDPLEVTVLGGPRLCLRRDDARAFPVERSET